MTVRDEKLPQYGWTTAEKADWLARRGVDTRKLLAHMIDGTLNYILFGLPPGGFAQAVFSNDLKDAFGRADDVNTAHMRDWVMFVYNEMPSEAQGSRERAAAWIDQGGLLHVRLEIEGAA